MNRRSFLKYLGVGAAVGVVAPATLIPKGTEVAWQPETIPMAHMPHFIPQYVDYVNFSEFSLSSAIDASVTEAAAELMKTHGLSRL